MAFTGFAVPIRNQKMRNSYLGLGENYRALLEPSAVRPSIFSCMGYRPPTVKLPIPPEKIDGQTVTFKPVRDGIDLEVPGVIQVIEDANGFNVNASYIVSQNPPLCRVYWFDQSEIDAIARSEFGEKRRILIVDDDRESTHVVKVLLERTGSYAVLEA